MRWITTPTTSDWAILPLPPGLFWVYRLLRPFRVARKYLPRLAVHALAAAGFPGPRGA